MDTHGDDSLNEHSEDEGLTPPSETGEDLIDEEPTEAQLIATGEMDDPHAIPHQPEPEETEIPEEVSEAPGTQVAVVEEPLSIRKEVEKRLMEGATREELIAEGFNKNTVRTVASEVKSKLGTRKPIGKQLPTTPGGLPIMAKGAPPELIIEALEIPDVSDGGGFPFEQGMKFGMSVVTLGIRMAQELSGIGVMQAKPLLDMAKSMREGEAVAAKNAAGEAAAEAAGMVQANLSPILASLQNTTPAGTDPMKAMMAKTMEPIMSKMMAGMLGGLIPGGAAQPQLTEAAVPETPTTDGWSRRTEEKPKEE